MQLARQTVCFFTEMIFLPKKILIPTTVLSTADSKPGLKGEYFSESNFEGTPMVRVDPSAMLQPFHPEPGSLTPPPGVKNFSVRWTGFLTPKESCTYLIGAVRSMNRLWLNDKVIVDVFVVD